MKRIFDVLDTIQLEDGDNYVGKFVILRLYSLSKDYQNALNQLFYCTGGFGCYPEKMGTKVFGKFYDECAYVRRGDILGVATEGAIKEWETEYAMSREVFVE